MFKQRLFRFSGFLLILPLLSCATTNASPRGPIKSGNEQPAQQLVDIAPTPPPAVTAACTACEARERQAQIARQQRDSVLRKLRLANGWHQQGRYPSAKEAYEAILAEQSSPLSDAYALWGIINLYLDRDNPEYSREDAQLVAHVLKQRARDAQLTDGVGEAHLLAFSVESLLVADASKDNVVAENRRLRTELAQREEAIRRLRELTVGR